MDFTHECWGHFNVSSSFLRVSVNSPGHYRAAATSQQLSDKERSWPHGEEWDLWYAEFSLGLCYEWFRTNEFKGLHMPSVGLNQLCYMETLDFPLSLGCSSHYTAFLFCAHIVRNLKFPPPFISQGESPHSQACVQQCDTSRRSMVTFARSPILSPSFSVTLSPAACSLLSFHSSEVSWRNSWWLVCHKCWVVTHCY